MNEDTHAENATFDDCSSYSSMYCYCSTIFIRNISNHNCCNYNVVEVRINIFTNGI